MIDLNDIITKTNASDLHQMGLTGKGVVVAVLDSGIDFSHDIFAETKIKTINLTDEPDEDLYGHGTHVSSILLAIAPEISILNIKIIEKDGNTKLSRIMKGIELAQKEGVDIINISAGEEVEACADNHPLNLIVRNATDEGIMVVCSAGNEGPKTSPFIPAACKTAIAVGSINSLGRTNKFSSRGPICNRKYPDCVAYGDNVFAAYPGGWKAIEGTSQASPQVAGMLALIKQYCHRSFTKEQIEKFLSESCRYLETYEKNNLSGWGAIDMAKFLRSVQIDMNKF